MPNIDGTPEQPSLDVPPENSASTATSEADKIAEAIIASTAAPDATATVVAADEAATATVELSDREHAEPEAEVPAPHAANNFLPDSLKHPRITPRGQFQF